MHWQTCKVKVGMIKKNRGSTTFPLFGIVTISATKLKMVKKKFNIITNMPPKSKRGPQLFCFITWITLLYCGPNFLSLHSLVFSHFLYVALIKKRRKYKGRGDQRCPLLNWLFCPPYLSKLQNDTQQSLINHLYEETL